MFNTFNMGIGMSLVVAPDAVDSVRSTIPDALIIGEVVPGSAGVEIC